MSAVEFYFDFSCPWTYLAFTRLQESAIRTGSGIHWKPVLVEDVRKQVNPAGADSRVEPIAAKAKYAADDLARWAEFCGISITLPTGWPVRPLDALTGMLVADQAGVAAKYAAGMFAAYFGDGRDIGARSVVLEVANSAGLDVPAFESGLDEEPKRATVGKNGEQLVERGGFGSPTMFVGELMFFGNDRMPLVEFALGQTSGRTFVMPGKHG
jgi:2-hydroxychromene-2-carboxylate isomerase